MPNKERNLMAVSYARMILDDIERTGNAFVLCSIVDTDKMRMLSNVLPAALPDLILAAQSAMNECANYYKEKARVRYDS